MRLEGRIDDPSLQLVQIEHLLAGKVIQVHVARVRQGAFFCPLELFRGPNQILVAAFDDSGRLEARELTVRTRLREWLEVGVISLALALMLRTFLLQAFEIPSLSMRPTLEKGDRILVDKFFFHPSGLRRGDLVVFSLPEDSVSGPSKTLVKRVVGLPGEEVKVQAGKIYLGEKLLPEAYLAPSEVVDESAPAQAWRIPQGSYFLLGDNRQASKDSRVFGAVPRERIQGRAFFRYWPPMRMEALP